MTMPVKVLSLMLVAALPLAGCGSTTTTGAAGGGVAGAVVGGPVGAVVGGVACAAVGAALSPEETTGSGPMSSNNAAHPIRCATKWSSAIAYPAV